MDADLYARLTYELKLLKTEREKCIAQLDILEPYKHFTLKRDVKLSGNSYYSVKQQGAKKIKYIGKESNPVILRIKEAAYLEAELPAIEHNIQLVEAMLSSYLSYDHSSINSALSFPYQKESIFDTSDYYKVGSIWKEQMLEHQSKFPENHPEHKVHRTSDGTMVKSISEVDLYNRFLEAGLIPIYELPLVLNDYGPPLYPDLTVLSPIDLQTVIIIEHVGKLSDYRYRAVFADKLGRYIRNGFIPGINLFFTFSDADGHVDSLQTNKIIADIKGIR